MYFSPISAICPAHLILFNFITLMMPDEEYRPWSSLYATFSIILLLSLFRPKCLLQHPTLENPQQIFIPYVLIINKSTNKWTDKNKIYHNIKLLNVWTPGCRNMYETNIYHKLYWFTCIFGWCINYKNLHSMNNIKLIPYFERQIFTSVQNQKQNYSSLFFDIYCFRYQIGRQKIPDRIIAGIFQV